MAGLQDVVDFTTQKNSQKATPVPDFSEDADDK
jgi:hypothetical protein